MAFVSSDWPAHPEFRRRFPDPLYRGDNEFGPFNTDEGSDMVAEWSKRRDELTSISSIAQLLEDGSSAADGQMEPNPDELVIAAGFTLLRLTGHINDDDRRTLVRALKRQRVVSPAGQPAFDTMLRDLGEVPKASSMSDELREMIDPDFHPDAHEGPWVGLGLVYVASRGDFPSPYVRQLGDDIDAMSADPDWLTWWQKQSASVLLYFELTCADKAPRKPLTVRHIPRREPRETCIRLGTARSEIDALGKPSSPTTIRGKRELARSHLTTMVAAVQKALDLDQPPAFPPLE